MSHIRVAFAPLDTNPSTCGLETFATQIETLSQMMTAEEMKAELYDCVRRILREQKFDQIRENEAMLRLYKVMGRSSTNLKGRGIYEQLFKKDHFTGSLKFYLQWAEECGKDQMLEEFKDVLKLARDRLSERIEMTAIESGFRDLVDEYFNGESGDMFTRPDETMDLFRFNAGSKKKRRSSVCFLQHNVPINNSGKAAFGPKTKTDLRQACIDRPNYHGISIEEFRFAKWKDTFGEDVDDDYRKRKDSGVVFVKHQVIDTDRQAREEVENRFNANLNPRRRHLSPVSEKTVDDEEEKRSRIYSPLVATKDAHRPALRSKIENPPATVTLSSDTKSASEKDVSDSDDADDDERLKIMTAGRKDGNPPDRSTSISSNYSTASARTSKSGAGLDLMAENKCLEAHAMFSDTVHLASEKTMVLGDDSVFVPERSLATTQIVTDFSVLCDPDPTMTITQERPKKVSNGLNVVYDEAAEPEESQKVEESEVQPEIVLVSPVTQTSPATMFNDIYDDEIEFGFFKPSRGNFVTSTPAQGVHLVNIDEYFGNKEEESTHEQEAPVFVAPTSSTFSKLTRRKSLAANQAVQPSVTESSKPERSDPKDSSIDCLTANLGRRLSIGADEIPNLTENNESEITGCKIRRRSEIIKQGDINPWDETLRKKLMCLVRPPQNMHEFQERAPKIQALRDCEVSGEKLHIQTLIGQGGYAKVYRAVTDDQRTVAVKYEVPSCSWEVYICDQMRNRLKDRGLELMAKCCIMEVMDAYVYSTASLLVNQYHEYGTLLEYANNMKDPNWHITCFLITQMARVVKEVHASKIIHGDIKPDNFMITRKIDDKWGKDALMSNDSFVIKIIDWGRAIDMMPLKNQRFKGRAGTEAFDCPEMVDGRSWTYQADYFGFAATMAVVVAGKYAQLTGASVGDYSLNVDIKRRNILRDACYDVINRFLNIPSCDSLPDWNILIKSFSEIWNEKFEASGWRQAVSKFNEACDLAANQK